MAVAMTPKAAEIMATATINARKKGHKSTSKQLFLTWHLFLKHGLSIKLSMPIKMSTPAITQNTNTSMNGRNTKRRKIYSMNNQGDFTLLMYETNSHIKPPN